MSAPPVIWIDKDPPEVMEVWNGCIPGVTVTYIKTLQGALEHIEHMHADRTLEAIVMSWWNGKALEWIKKNQPHLRQRRPRLIFALVTRNLRENLMDSQDFFNIISCPCASGWGQVRRDVRNKLAASMAFQEGAEENAHAEKPCLPPGKHLKLFRDEKVDELWWYYEGEHGKWWSIDGKLRLYRPSADQENDAAEKTLGTDNAAQDVADGEIDARSGCMCVRLTAKPHERGGGSQAGAQT